MEKAASDFDKPDDEVESPGINRIDLNTVEGHQSFNYKDLLKIIVDDLKQKDSGQSDKNTSIKIVP